ncbi:MAG: hypothetical protein PGN15_01670 [Aeromicrobium erythreum]
MSSTSCFATGAPTATPESRFAVMPSVVPPEMETTGMPAAFAACAPAVSVLLSKTAVTMRSTFFCTKSCMAPLAFSTAPWGSTAVVFQPFASASLRNAAMAASEVSSLEANLTMPIV